MIISDYELKVGQEIGLNMSFIEQLGEEVNETYLRNIKIQEEHRLKNKK